MALLKNYKTSGPGTERCEMVKMMVMTVTTTVLIDGSNISIRNMYYILMTY